MIALFAALELEARPLVRLLEAPRPLAVAVFRCTRGRLGAGEVLVCRTGMGRRAGAAVREVLAAYPAQAVVSFGVCGGLSPDLNVGDVVLCERTQSAASGERIASGPHLLAAAKTAAGTAGVPARTGGALTADDPLATPAEKQALCETTGLDIVEMEGFWVAEATRAQGLPFLGVRAVSDDCRSRLPLIPGIISPDGGLRAWRIVPYVIAHPASIPDLWRLGRGQSLAMSNLVRLLRALLPALAASGAAAQPREGTLSHD